MSGGYTFHAYVYRIAWDDYEWRGYTRESLIDEVVRSSTRGTYALRRAVRARIAARGSLTDYEMEAILGSWAWWWQQNGPSVRLAEKLGIDQVRDMRGDTLAAALAGCIPSSSAVGASVSGNYLGQPTQTRPERHQ